MKKMTLPIIILIIAIAIAHFFFKVDVEGFFKGFIDFLGELLDGPG